MGHRFALIGLLLVAMTLGLVTAVPAQAPVPKVIDVTLSEFKIEPNQISFNEGDTIVIRMRNVGPRFPHNIAARYWANIPLTVRGDARQGVDEERKGFSSSLAGRPRSSLWRRDGGRSESSAVSASMPPPA